MVHTGQLLIQNLRFRVICRRLMNVSLWKVLLVLRTYRKVEAEQ
jgi:hypothetical protein